MAQWNPLRKPTESALDDELRFHIETLVEEKIAAGMTPEQARREAALEFGGREQMKEEIRDVHRIATLENTIANLKSGVRLIRKSPSFSMTVMLTLALGIGANSAVFSAIDAILLRPLPFPDGDQLMFLRQFDRKAKNPSGFVAPARVEDWNRFSSAFRAVSAYYTGNVSEVSGALPEKVTEAYVAPRFLEVWGVAPELGRTFSTREEHFGGPDSVLISDRYWRRRFNADPNVIGRQLRLEQRSATIIGVMPESFAFPVADADVWTPSAPDAPYSQDRSSTWFTVVGRLKPGVSVAQARADMDRVQAQLGRQFPKTDGDLGVQLQPLKETTVGDVRRSLWLLFGSVSLLLLIACANIAALLMARGAERSREISVRFSLGAARSSVIAQLLTECLVLAVAGSALGLALATGGSAVLRAYAKSLPRVGEIALNWRIVAYTLAAAMLSTLIAGLLPALRATRRSLAGELASSSRNQVSTRNPLQWALVGVQVALAVTLLTGAGLLLRSFEELGRVSPGFEISHILTLRVSGNWGETTDFNKLNARINRTLDEVRATPGVLEAATAVFLPGIPGDTQSEIRITEGRAPAEGKIIVDSRWVSNGYFETMRIPLIAGAGCGRDPRPEVLVNRSFATAYFSGTSPIGHHIEQVSNPFGIPPGEIRGIVADAREEGLNHAPAPATYWCISAPTPDPNYLIRTQGAPLAMAETLRQRIHAIEPARSVFNISPLADHLSDNFAEARLRTILLTLFALTAVTLACVGLYGALSYFVTARKREIGLRLALGAVRSRIVAHFLLRGMGLAVAACVAGIGLAVAFARLLAGMLYGISAADGFTLASVVVLILGVAGVASLLPAVRAAHVEPMQVLRDE